MEFTQSATKLGENINGKKISICICKKKRSCDSIIASSNRSLADLRDGLRDGKLGGLIGGTGLFAMLLSAYGFALGLSSFSEENRKHRTSMIGSILNGVILVIWLGLFLSGV